MRQEENDLIFQAVALKVHALVSTCYHQNASLLGAVGQVFETPPSQLL